MTTNRRNLLLSGLFAASFGALPPAIARALDIPANRRTGTIKDVEHVVILTQENRAFDHYFGGLRGVRGFSDRFPAPTKNGTVWLQPDESDSDRLIAPFRFNTKQNFAHMRASGTPHTFSDAQKAWDNGRMDAWTKAKHNHAMGYFTREDIPFQYALAEAFTLCDAYHCSIHAGTDPNRLFVWTGTNDPLSKGHGPAVVNKYDTLKDDPDGHGGYAWTTYPERLSQAGVTWQLYQNAKDNFDDNTLVGFKVFRDADKADNELARRGIRTRDLDMLKADVMAGTLPQVSWVVAPASLSEHPGPSSPAQGADYTARVLDALTANPEVWAKTVFLINFDENDGYFDHVPPPAPPARLADGFAGESQVDTTGEYHLPEGDWQGRPYGLGPRVPLYVISPWSKGGYVNSQVFDHTSVLRFLETRFGVIEPNISAWRRAVCGDLTSCFDFANPDHATFFSALPATADAAKRAGGYLLTKTPTPPEQAQAPVQEPGQRPARPLPYDLEANYLGGSGEIELVNNSPVAVVFHVYNLHPAPLRYTVASGGRSVVPMASPVGTGIAHVMAPNGFTRLVTPFGPQKVSAQLSGKVLKLSNTEAEPVKFTLLGQAYDDTRRDIVVAPGDSHSETLDLTASDNWYDFSVVTDHVVVRFAGHVESGSPSKSDPALGGPARLRG